MCIRDRAGINHFRGPADGHVELQNQNNVGDIGCVDDQRCQLHAQCSTRIAGSDVYKRQAYLYNDIALKFQENGYEVLVLTTTPHYNVVESQLAAQPLK